MAATQSDGVPVNQSPPPRVPAPERVVSTKDLLAGGHRLWIEHATERYLLQVTRSGKLILTK
jgi:hemin uptake protein HemP